MCFSSIGWEVKTLRLERLIFLRVIVVWNLSSRWNSQALFHFTYVHYTYRLSCAETMCPAALYRRSFAQRLSTILPVYKPNLSKYRRYQNSEEKMSPSSFYRTVSLQIIE